MKNSSLLVRCFLCALGYFIAMLAVSAVISSKIAEVLIIFWSVPSLLASYVLLRFGIYFAGIFSSDGLLVSFLINTLAWTGIFFGIVRGAQFLVRKFRAR